MSLRADTDEQRERELRRLYVAAREFLRALNAGEASVSGVQGWVYSDMSRALERIPWDVRRWGEDGDAAMGQNSGT